MTATKNPDDNHEPMPSTDRTFLFLQSHPSFFGRDVIRHMRGRGYACHVVNLYLGDWWFRRGTGAVNYTGSLANWPEWLERFMAEHVSQLSWLEPQALGIIAYHMVGEFTAGLAAAGALISTGGLSSQQIVNALHVGTVLSSPMRAMRHQFPYYAGIFPAGMALRLIVYNQALRVLSVILVAVGYAALS